MKREKRSNPFLLVKDFFDTIQRGRNFLKFRGEMYIYLRSHYPYTDKKFYELEINELEENNRLEKLKMEEAESEKKSASSQSIRSEEHLMNDVDLNEFFQLNKKRNKVVLFPSNNIFLKDENNQALAEISHIYNIKLSIRFIVVIFIIILLTILVAEIIVAKQFQKVTEQMDCIDRFQKVSWILNNLYNMQHIAPESSSQQVFFIRMLGKILKDTFSSLAFQKLLFDPDINPLVVIKPYFPDPYPYPILANISSYPLGSVGAFRKILESIVALETYLNMNETDPL